MFKLLAKGKNEGAWAPGGWRPLVVAVSALGVALVLRQALDPFMGEHFRFVFFWFAALLVGAYAGIRYGFFVAAAGLVIAFYFFVHPYRSFSGIERSDLNSIIVYLLNTSVLLVLIEWLQRSKYEARMLMLETIYRNRRLEEILGKLAESEKMVDHQSEKIGMLAATAPHIWSMRRCGGKAEYFSAELYEMTGLSRRVLDGGGWTNALHPDEAEKVRDVSARVEKTGVSERIRVRLRFADGEHHSFGIECSRLEDKHGRVIVWSGPGADARGVPTAEAKSPERIRPQPT